MSTLRSPVRLALPERSVTAHRTYGTPRSLYRITPHPMLYSSTHTSPNHQRTVPTPQLTARWSCSALHTGTHRPPTPARGVRHAHTTHTPVPSHHIRLYHIHRSTQIQSTSAAHNRNKSHTNCIVTCVKFPSLRRHYVLSYDQPEEFHAARLLLEKCLEVRRNEIVLDVDIS